MVYAWPFENLHGFCILLFVLFFLGFEFFFLCYLFWVLGFDLYLVVIQTRNHPMVLTRSIDDLCHWVRPELSVGRGSIFCSLNSIGSNAGQRQTKSDLTHVWWFSFLKYFFLMCVLNLNQASSVYLSDPNRSRDVFSWSWQCNGA